MPRRVQPLPPTAIVQAWSDTEAWQDRAVIAGPTALKVSLVHVPWLSHITIDFGKSHTVKITVYPEDEHARIPMLEVTATDTILRT